MPLTLDPTSAQDMRFRWVEDRFYYSREVSLARALLDAVVDNKELQHKLRRSLGDYGAHPDKLLALVPFPHVPGLLAKTPRMPLVLDSFACLTTYYGLLEMGLELGLIPWPMQKTVATRILLHLNLGKYEEYYLHRYHVPLVAALRNRLAKGIPLKTPAPTLEISCAYTTLLSLYARMLADRDFKYFLFYFWFSHHAKTLGLPVDQPHGDDFRPEDAWRPGYFAFVHYAMEIRELVSASGSRLFADLADALFRPWEQLARTHSGWLREVSHVFISDLQKETLEKRPQDARRVHAAFHEAQKATDMSLLPLFSGEDDDQGSVQARIKAA